MYEFLDYRVQDVMSKPVSVREDTPLAEVERLLEERGWNALPVVDSAERVVGLVTSLDLLKAFAFSEDRLLPPFEEIMQRSVRSVMTRDVQGVAPTTPLPRVLQRIVDTRNKSFPVIDGDRLVGVVARVDVLFALRRALAGSKGAGPSELS